MPGPSPPTGVTAKGSEWTWSHVYITSEGWLCPHVELHCFAVWFASFAWRSLQILRDAHDLCPLSCYSRGCERLCVGKPGPPLQCQNLGPLFLVAEVPNRPGSTWHELDSPTPDALFNAQFKLMSREPNFTNLCGFFCSHLNNNCKYIKVILLKTITCSYKYAMPDSFEYCKHLR